MDEWEIGVSLTTPTKLEEFQEKLYVKAKAEPTFRFYQLYDKLYRWDVLVEALRRAKANRGAAGVDGQTFEQVMGLPRFGGQWGYAANLTGRVDRSKSTGLR